MVKYCLPIIENNVSSVFDIIKRNEQRYQYFEVWLDYLSEGCIDLVKELSFQLGERVVFLFRRQNLEQIQMPFDLRCHVIREIANSNSYLDLDLTTQPGELEFARNEVSDLALVLSYHNYEFTPDRDELDEIIEKMWDNDAAIYKISTMCRSREDALLLLTLCLELSEAGDRFIVLGMGEHGSITRIFGTLWGNEMIFAPALSEKNSAPGQLTRDQLEQCFEALG
jgi:3-dehydroquinate dehydratase I